MKGEVEVHVLSDAPGRFAPGSVMRSPLRSLTVSSTRARGDRTVVSFEEIIDRNAAEALTGSELTIDKSSARPLEEAEYWDHDLIGCEVFTTDGARVGEVSDVLHQSANDILVVGDHLIPLIKDVIKEVVRGERITIDPIPGLLD